MLAVISLVAGLMGPVRTSGAGAGSDQPRTSRGATAHTALIAPSMAGGQDGTVDPSFKSGSGLNYNLQAIAVQSDGKILIGGRFTTYNETTANGIIRLNPDSTRDTTFNPGGTGANDGVFTIAVQDDGKILIGGRFTSYNRTTANAITRLNPDGSRDTTFNPGGTGANIAVSAIVLQSDGKILIGGAFNIYNGTTTKAIARLNPNGSLDTTFNAGGTGGNAGGVQAIALQSDGKILIGGFFTAYNGTTLSRVARLNSDGTLDSTFNPGGAGTNSGGDIYAIALQNDGRILIGGFFTTYNGVTANYIARLNSDGSRDTTFNPGGAGPDFAILAIAVQSDGNILIGGVFITYNGVTANNFLRLNPDGTRDNTFNPGGTGANSEGEVYTIVVQSDGNILIGGAFTSYNSYGHNRLARLNPDGSPDLTFNSGGTGANNMVSAIVVQNDGKILIGGAFTTYNGVRANRLARLNPNGSLDTIFNPGGTGFNGAVYTIALQSDDKILVGGAFTSYNGTTANAVTRLNPDGSLDATFNPGGTGANSAVKATAVQSDGKTLIAGAFTTYNGTSVTGITRLNLDGSHDTNFNPGGAGSTGSINVIRVQSDGKIITGGDFTAYNGTAIKNITRLNPAGSLDSTFNPGGTGTNSAVKAVAVQSDGKILIGGEFSSYNGVTTNRIIRLNSAGSLDPTFNAGGAGLNGGVSAIVLQSDSQILSAGFGGTSNGFLVQIITRLNPDGTRDTTFNSGGAGPNIAVSAIAVQNNGKILIGGSFTSVDTITRDHIARLLNGPCEPLVVTHSSDDGAASLCGTFSYALVRASAGMTITFDLGTNNTITFTGSLTPTVQSGVTIDGSQGAGNITMYGNGVDGDGLQLVGQNRLINLTIRKFRGRELVTLGPGNVLKQVVILQT